MVIIFPDNLESENKKKKKKKKSGSFEGVGNLALFNYISFYNGCRLWFSMVPSDFTHEIRITLWYLRISQLYWGNHRKSRPFI